MKISSELQRKLVLLEETLGALGRVAVAFSGGADSSLLLKVAHDTLGANAIAFFADSEVQPLEERQGAIDMAGFIGAPLEIVDFKPLALPEFVANSKRRCYHCKKSIFSTFLSRAQQSDFPWLADGTNYDDLSKDRPGAFAVTELGVRSPLAEACLTKREIRELSQLLGLPTWDKPSASCLATRIPTGMPITAADLLTIGKAERILHDLGYHGCRVRLAGPAPQPDRNCAVGSPHPGPLPKGEGKNGCAIYGREQYTFYLEFVSGDIDRLLVSGNLRVVRDSLLALGANKVLLDLLERESILS